MRSALTRLLARLGLLALVIAAVLLPVVHSLAEPAQAMAMFVLGPLRDLRSSGNVLEAATPLLFTGLAVSLMLRAGMLNLGAEGAAFLGGVLATCVLLKMDLPPWAMGASAIVIGGMVGASVCLVPGWLKLRYGASELVSSLMLNYAALFLGLCLVNYVLRDPEAGAMMSYRLPAEGRLPRILPGTRVHLGLLIGLLACGVGGAYLFRTRWGYEARLVGSNPDFARNLGLSTATIGIAAQALGGFIAAAGGAIEIQGMYTRFTWTDLPGLGWNGLVVAILAGNNPLLVPLAALALAYLQVGGDLLARNFNVPTETVGLIKAMVILFSTASISVGGSPLARLWARWRRGAAHAPARDAA